LTAVADVVEKGEPLEAARAAMVLLHGRGATPEDIYLDCAGLLGEPGFAFLAPRAAGGAWYPQPFTAPLESNEPWLSQALATIDTLLRRIEEIVPIEQQILLGFSQGGCLALEYAARRARRYGAVVGFSAALIGPPDLPRRYEGSLAGTPVFLGCSDHDPYVAADLVTESAAVVGRLGGEVDLRFYSGMGHIVSADEIARVRRLMSALTRRKEEIKAWQ
jgi:predicted esterase